MHFYLSLSKTIGSQGQNEVGMGYLGIKLGLVILLDYCSG